MSGRSATRLLAFTCFCLSCTLVLLPASAQAKKGKKYALLVGVQEYDHAKQFKPLSYAENDVNETAKELTKAGYSVILLSTSDDKNKPTLANIEKHLDALLAKATKHDLIMVGLAGHGMQFDKKEDSYFCPVDARVNDTKTMLSMRSVYKKLEDSPVGVGLLLVDACRDDGGPRSTKKRGVDGDKLPSPPKGVAALFSCSSGQFAWETGKFKHGVFFHFVLEGLRGKAVNSRGAVTWGRLSEYVSEQVAETVPVLIGGGAKQEPHEMKSLAGISPVLLDPAKEDIVQGWPKKIINSIGMELVQIPAGTFSMGSDEDEQKEMLKVLKLEKAPDWLKAEGPEHDVKISKSFHLGIHEVTQKQFKQVMGYNPSYFSRDGDGKEGVTYSYKPAGGKGKLDADYKPETFPVDNISWEEAKEFCEKLSALEKEKKHGRLYRLPTEAEWEYACRGGPGLKTAFHFGQSLSSDQANFDGNYPYGGAAKSTYLERTCKVGSYKPNKFGLYDMHGNVWEWCNDRYGEKYYAESPKNDPGGPSEGSLRVFRGGGWFYYGGYCRCADRGRGAPSGRDRGSGCRVALVPFK